MDENERAARMWTDLLTAEMRAVSEHHSVTERALIYIDAGLPLDSALDALKISRATWYRRVRDHKAWQSANSAAWERRESK